MDRLTTSDWSTLHNIAEFLKGFYDTTIKTKECKATVETILPAIDFLLEWFEKRITKYAHSAYMISSIQTSWDKLEKYYKLTEQGQDFLQGLADTWTEMVQSTEMITNRSSATA